MVWCRAEPEYWTIELDFIGDTYEPEPVKRIFFREYGMQVKPALRDCREVHFRLDDPPEIV